MSITSAMGSALSGLSATSRQAEIISSNLANATTPGYARREISLRAAVLAGTGQGVAIGDVTRTVDRQLLAERRLAEASDGDRSARSDFLMRVETAFGTPDSAGSLAGRVAAFDQALLEAAGRPDSEARLAQVLQTAQALVAGLTTATDDIQAARSAADLRISEQVGLLNTTLSQLEDLNRSLLGFTTAGRDISALLDERQRLVDTISAIVPIREVPRSMNQVAIYTLGGAPLLEGKASELGFFQTRTITPEMSQALGGLSGLTLNGRSIETAGTGSLIQGGSLGALFAVRDELAVDAQGKLDAVARDLIERFSAAGLDPTLAPGAAGLFTDRGLPFAAVDETGIAGRLSVNAAADPAQGGALFRLRAGLAATSAGSPGAAGILPSLQRALSAPQPLASSGFTAGTRSFASLVGDLLSSSAANRLAAETERSFTVGRLNALKDVEAQNGIDTDQEMQALLIVEKNYGANARVVQTLNEMIDILIRLGG